MTASTLERPASSSLRALGVARAWGVYVALIAIVHVGIGAFFAWLHVYLDDAPSLSAFARADIVHSAEAMMIAPVVALLIAWSIAVALHFAGPAPTRREWWIAVWLAVPVAILVVIPLVVFKLTT